MVLRGGKKKKSIPFLPIPGRLYLGYHSPADVIVGVIIGAILPFLWLQLDEKVEMFILYGQNGEGDVSVYKININPKELENGAKMLVCVTNSVDMLFLKSLRCLFRGSEDCVGLGKVMVMIIMIM